MAAPTAGEIDKVIYTKELAKSESVKIEAIKLDAQQIEGTRYKFRISEAESE